MDDRTCVACGVNDDGPRHQVDLGGNLVYWHFKCHDASADGCESCHSAITDAGGSDTESLTAHFDKLTADAAVQTEGAH